jgi:hypothetical protein
VAVVDQFRGVAERRTKSVLACHAVIAGPHPAETKRPRQGLRHVVPLGLAGGDNLDHLLDQHGRKMDVKDGRQKPPRALADWIKTRGVETGAMESTGVYCIPLSQILEACGLEVCLVSAKCYARWYAIATA